MSKAADLANLIGNINAGGGGVNRNLIINGAMNVAQRGTSFADVANGTYTLDRFVRHHSNDGAVTITQDSSSPDGFSNSLKVDVTTADTSLASTQNEIFAHKVEAQNLQSLAFGTSSAKNFTVSFYVKSNKTGTYAVNIAQSDNSSKQATLTYTINSADTWERKSLTFTGDTSGVINDDNGTGFEMSWFLAAGTGYTSGSASASFATYSNANYAAGQTVNLLDSTDNTWFITGVQLEVGQNATEFEHEPYEETLRKSRRYFQTIESLLVRAHGTTSIVGFTPIHPMRATPTATTTGTVTVNNIGTSNNAQSSGDITLSTSTDEGVEFSMGNFSSLTDDLAYGLRPQNGHIQLLAEL